MARSTIERSLSTRNAIVCLVTIALVGFALGKLTANRNNTGQVNVPTLGINVDTQELKQIALQSHRGTAINWGSLSGKPRVVFFGYTFCPDICPLGLSNVAGAVDILDEQGLELDPVFITVDPKRDTPEVLRHYVSAFHERLQGLTGKNQKIKTLASAFRAFYEVNADTKGDEYYLVDHTSYVYLVDDSGGVIGYYPESKIPQELAAEMLADFRQFNSN